MCPSSVQSYRISEKITQTNLVWTRRFWKLVSLLNRIIFEMLNSTKGVRAIISDLRYKRFDFILVSISRSSGSLLGRLKVLENCKKCCSKLLLLSWIAAYGGGASRRIVQLSGGGTNRPPLVPPLSVARATPNGEFDLLSRAHQERFLHREKYGIPTRQKHSKSEAIFAKRDASIIPI